MNQTKFPDGWDEGKIPPVLTSYEERNEEDAMIEDEAGVQSSETVMAIPHEVVPEVRELIAKHHR